MFGQTDLSRQCKHRFDAAERGALSWSTLFAFRQAILDTPSVGELYLFKFSNKKWYGLTKKTLILLRRISPVLYEHKKNNVVGNR